MPEAEHTPGLSTKGVTKKLSMSARGTVTNVAYVGIYLKTIAFILKFIKWRQDHGNHNQRNRRRVVGAPSKI